MPWMWVLPATILTLGAVMAAFMVRRLGSAGDDLTDAGRSLDSMGHAAAELVDSTAALNRSDKVIRDRLVAEPGANSFDR